MARSKVLILAVVLITLVAALSVSSVSAQDETLRITLFINGTLGDKSFFDSAQRGLDNLIDDGFNIEVNTIEAGTDPNAWEPGIDDAMSDVDNYDIFIAGTYQVPQFVAARSHLYPDKSYIFFDAPMPYDDPELCVEGCSNVYSILYSQNEGSLLAGVYAGAMTISGIDGMNEEAIIGSIGGQDIPVINDFVVAYEQGACLVNPESVNISQYVGGVDGWSNPARAKEITLALYEQGADIVFNVAGGSGDGMFEAAEEEEHYTIGVDSDQASIILETAPERAERILTSMEKRVDNSLYRAIELFIEGELPVGEIEVLGIEEGGVQLSDNEIYQAATPDNVKELIAAVQEAVIAGDIVANTAFGDNPTPVGQPCSDMPETDFDASEYLSAE
jgi:basic membrane protein A and related proteins